MELSLVAVLAVFVLLALSGGAYFLSKKSGVPHTVILVVLGVLLIPVAHLPGFAFLDAFRLTPELLFYIFLPTLIFESAFNMNIRRLTADAIPITLLSVASLLISALAIATVLWLVLPLVGLPLPFLVTFVFGALISATDPVAVLALFKEYGVPRRLALLFEGESLFNDGTAFALFAIALGMATSDAFSVGTFAEGTASFFVMILGGAAFGLAAGGIFAKAIGYAKSNETVAITLMLVLAHTTFLLSELISHNVEIAGFRIQLSAIIATTVAAMVIGNYGRAKLPLHAGAFIEQFWGQIAFFANSIVFILIGTLAVSLPLTNPGLIVPIIIVAVTVAASRALSIYPVLAFWNRIAEPFARIPRSWQHLLAWGSLRGALAVTMALLIPSDWNVAAGNVQYIVLAFTTGCIFVTLFAKATTIGPLMKRLGADDFDSLERVEHDVARAHLYARVSSRIDEFAEKGYLRPEVAATLRTEYAARFEKSKEAYGLTRDETGLEEAALRAWALSIEREALHELYRYGEVSEPVYKHVLDKLTIRLEQVERGYSNSEIHLDVPGDIFEWSAEAVRKLARRPDAREDARELYVYYRACSIIAQKALRELRTLAEAPDPVFSRDAVVGMIGTYEMFEAHTLETMRALETAHPELAVPLSDELARRAVRKVEEQALERYREREMITPKVYLTLRSEIDHEV